MISQNVTVLSWLVMSVVGLIDIEHMQSVIKGFLICFCFCFFLNCYYFSDLETQWPRNPDLNWDFAGLQQLSEGVGHNIEEKSLSSVSEQGIPLTVEDTKTESGT